MKKLLLALAPVVLLAACAMDPASTSTEASNDKVYRTGSNIPRKDKGDVQTMTPEEMEQMRNSSRANTGRGPGG
jgi:hypothetical protein